VPTRKDWPFILSADFAKLREAQKKAIVAKRCLLERILQLKRARIAPGLVATLRAAISHHAK
jgi:hypothetical protein